MDYLEFKERVRSANNIVDVIGNYVDLKRSGSSFKGLCPFHSERTPSFFVMPEDQFFYCHGCHKGGDVFKFICDYNNIEFSEAVRELANRAGINIPEKFDTGKDIGYIKTGYKNRLYDMYKDAAGFYYTRLHEKVGEKALSYLKDRGVGEGAATAFGLGFAPGHEQLYIFLRDLGYTEDEMKESGLFSYKSGKPQDMFFNRLIFPILNRSSRVIAFGGRIIGDGQPKYLNSPETLIYSKKDNLYGIHRAKKSQSGRIFLVEGYMDVISVQQAGYIETVASLGTALTPEQAGIIARMVRKVYLIYDSDEAGTNAKLRAIPILKNAGLYVNVVSMSPYKDPDELLKNEGRAGFDKRIDAAETALIFELECIQKKYNRSDPAENAGFESECAKKISVLDNRFEREQYIKAVSAGFSIDETLLQKEVDRLGSLRISNEGITASSRNMSGYDYRPPAKGSENVFDEVMKDEINVLSALLKNPEYLPKVSEYLNVDDFSDGLYRQLAAMIYNAGEKGGLTVGRILGHFDSEDQSGVSAVFHNQSYDDLNPKQRSIFLSDSIKAVLIRKNERLMVECDEEQFEKCKLEKKRLDKMKYINIME